ncbi:MAG: molybdopterin molybdotransferase MoeA [Steroidobacteraceae bacterium]
MLTPAQAEALIGQHLACLPIESLPVGYCAGAILRENVYAERDQPPFDRVAMDGIALTSDAVRTGTRRFRIAGVQAAGEPPMRLDAPTDCIEIMTGAMLPTGCDAVVPVERISVAAQNATLEPDLRVEPFQNVHRRGSDKRQGALLLQSGVRLEVPEIAVAAGAGMARVRVSQQPAVMVISTGNELVEPGEPIEPYQLRRSNAYALAAALRRRGFNRVADDHLPDDSEVLHRRLKLHLDTHGVLILSGGVSMGKFDLVPGVLRELGVQQVFHHIAQRPGKPMWFGTTASGRTVFALPGNPVSTLVCLARYVFPALAGAMGGRTPPGDRIALGALLSVRAPLAAFIPVRVEIDDWGRPWAVPCPHNGSGDYSALAGTDGFVELPPGPNDYPKGFVARLYRW